MVIDNPSLWHASLRHPAGNIPLPEGEPCITIHKCLFLAHGIFFLLRPRVFSRALGSVALMEPAGTSRRKCGPWPTSVARALGVQSRQSPGHSEHVGPSRPVQTQVQDKRMSDGLCNIWDLECHQCRQTLLGDGKVFPDTNMPDMRPLLIQ